jgi:hypothetical protein
MSCCLLSLPFALSLSKRSESTEPFDWLRANGEKWQLGLSPHELPGLRAVYGCGFFRLAPA